MGSRVTCRGKRLEGGGSDLLLSQNDYLKWKSFGFSMEGGGTYYANVRRLVGDPSALGASEMVTSPLNWSDTTTFSCRRMASFGAEQMGLYHYGICGSRCLVDGDDPREGTPSLEAGRCTRMY